MQVYLSRRRADKLLALLQASAKRQLYTSRPVPSSKFQHNLVSINIYRVHIFLLKYIYIRVEDPVESIAMAEK